MTERWIAWSPSYPFPQTWKQLPVNWILGQQVSLRFAGEDGYTRPLENHSIMAMFFLLRRGFIAADSIYPFTRLVTTWQRPSPLPSVFELEYVWGAHTHNRKTSFELGFTRLRTQRFTTDQPSYPGPGLGHCDPQLLVICRLWNKVWHTHENNAGASIFTSHIIKEHLWRIPKLLALPLTYSISHYNTNQWNVKRTGVISCTVTALMQFLFYC